jgi:hypothetical protein
MRQSRYPGLCLFNGDYYCNYDLCSNKAKSPVRRKSNKASLVVATMPRCDHAFFRETILPYLSQATQVPLNF